MYTRTYRIPTISPQTYERYYLNQIGSGSPVYRGSTHLQRGYGLGGLMRGLFRSALPILKKGAAAVGKEALQASVDIAQDVMSGQNVKSAAKRRLKTAGRNMGAKVMDKIQKGKGTTSKRATTSTAQKRGKKRSRVYNSVSSGASKRRRKTHNDIFG